MVRWAWAGSPRQWARGVIFDYVFIDSPSSFTLESSLSFLHVAGFVGIALLICYVTTSLHWDIARRERGEAELQRAEIGRSRLVAIFEATTDLVLTFDVSSRETYLNLAGRRMLGFGDQELIEIDRVAARQPAWVKELIQTEALPTVERDGVWTGEAAYLDAQGREVAIDTVLMAHRGSDGTIASYSAVCRDISERKQAADALATSLLLLEGTLEATADGIPMRRQSHSERPCTWWCRAVPTRDRRVVTRISGPFRPIEACSSTWYDRHRQAPRARDVAPRARSAGSGTARAVLRITD